MTTDDEVTSARLLEAALRIGADPLLELHGLVVLRRGEPVLEHYWEPYRAGDRGLVYSCSKTLTATAIGLAESEGLLSVGDRVVDLLPEAAGDLADDERVGQLRVHHLLSMSTGHTADTIDAVMTARPQEWARRLLEVRPQEPVGSLHVYNNGASFLLGEIVRVRTGSDLLDYLRARVLEPMGIDATWDRDPIGRCLGWSGAHLTTGWLAAFGELYRCDGVWQGRRLLPEGWVARATTRHIPTTHDTGSDWACGYGYQLWISREGFRLDGAFGQFALVLPEREVVVGITSAEAETQHLLDRVWSELLPALDGTSGGSGAPAGAGGSEQGNSSPHDSGLGGHWTAARAEYDPSLAPPAEEVPAMPVLDELAAERVGDGFAVTFTTEDTRVAVNTRAGGWQRQQVRIGGAAVPVAARAEADGEGALAVQVAFVETPHMLRLRLRPDGSAGMAWSVPPLQTPELSNQRAA